MMFSFLSTISQDESHSISENVKWAYRERFKRGEYDANRNGELVVNAEEAPTVRRIFQMCMDGIGSVRIANALQAEAIPTKRGAVWQPGTIRAILSNITYV